MGIIKPLPSGEVAAQLVALTERASSQGFALHQPRVMRGSASRTARKLFVKSFLDLQKLLKMSVVNPPSRWHAVFIFSPLRQTTPPPRRKRLTIKNKTIRSYASIHRMVLFSLA